MGALSAHRPTYDWDGDLSPDHESDAIIYELHVKGFTRNPNSGVAPSRAGTYAGLVEKIPYLKELGATIVELMPVFQRDPQGGDYWDYMPLSSSPLTPCTRPPVQPMSSISNFEIW